MVGIAPPGASQDVTPKSASAEAEPSGMMERVARKLARAFHKEVLGKPSKEASDRAEERWEGYAFAARAAIAAMREPTPQQVADATFYTAFHEPTHDDWVLAGRAKFLLPATDHPDAEMVLAEIARDYRAMIEAALRLSAADTSTGIVQARDESNLPQSGGAK